uniref:Uncharacterized protein n=1 Tax=Magallana gigas TaxID=29159 RepID=A0A8W8LVV4_MAGGI
MSSFQFIILFLIVSDIPDYVITEENTSDFTFLYTEKASPLNIEDFCFDINKASVNTMYLGISSFVNKNTSCKPENLLLREVQKYIILDKHQRQLCRTKITVSIKSRKGEKVIEDLKYGCQHLDGNSTIFFQYCYVNSFPEHFNTTTGGAGAITILTFPTRKLGDQGHTFEILRAQCNMKEWEVNRCLANKMRKISTPPSTDELSTQKVFVQVIVGGCVGLIVGILSTTFVCVCIYKHYQSRIINNDLISKSKTHRMTGTTRMLFIHSKDDEIVYNDILDIQDPSKKKEILHSESNVINHNDFQDLQYTESTSTYENEIDTVLFDKILISSKEYKTRNEPSDMYKEFSKEDKSASTSITDKNRLKSETVTVDIQDAATSKAMARSLQTENKQQLATYEEPDSWSKSKSVRDVKPDTNAALAFNGDSENLKYYNYHI